VQRGARACGLLCDSGSTGGGAWQVVGEESKLVVHEASEKARRAEERKGRSQFPTRKASRQGPGPLGSLKGSSPDSSWPGRQLPSSPSRHLARFAWQSRYPQSRHCAWTPYGLPVCHRSPPLSQQSHSSARHHSTGAHVDSSLLAVALRRHRQSLSITNNRRVLVLKHTQAAATRLKAALAPLAAAPLSLSPRP